MTWIEALRRRKSWTQARLAEEAGLSEKTVRRFEADGSASLDTNRRLAQALAVPLDPGSPEGKVWLALAAHADEAGNVGTTWDELSAWMGHDAENFDPHEVAIHLNHDGMFRTAYFEGGPEGACVVTLRL